MHDLKGSKKLLSSTEDRPIFEKLEGLRPRTSKTVLEAKDVLEAAASDNNNNSFFFFSLFSQVLQTNYSVIEQDGGALTRRFFVTSAPPCYQYAIDTY